MKWRILASIVLLQLLSLQAQAAGVQTVGLRADAAENPLGIENSRPRFTWRLDAQRRGVMQSAYQVLVASDPARLAPGQADLWDSGQVASARPSADYAGTALTSRRKYFWNVRTWDDAGDASAFAPVASFETAFLANWEWSAEWIAGPARALPGPVNGVLDDPIILASGEFCRPVLVPGPLLFTNPARLQEYFSNLQGLCRNIRPAPLLRREFALQKPVRRARLYASGIGYADIYINGQQLGEGAVLDPGYTDYGKTVLYRSHDVTTQLQTGENVIGMELGSGFYDHDVVTEWGWTQADWRRDPRLIAELHVEFADGTQQVIGSDAHWKATNGPTRYDNINIGETYDARFAQPGWAEPGFDDSGWAAARVVEAPGGRLTAQTHEPIAVLETLTPIASSSPVVGVTIYDLGEQISGWAEIEITAPRGIAVSLIYGEAKSTTGFVGNITNFHIGDQLQTDYYVSDGSPRQRWRPRFSYKGFRYIQVAGQLNGPVALPFLGTVHGITVQRVRSAVRQTGGFTSSHELINDIHAMVTRAVPNNLHGIVTDTPIYEKNGWTGDAQLTAPTAMLLFDMQRFYAKWLRDIRDSQKHSGEIPEIVPSGKQYGYTGVGWEPTWGATPAWDAALFLIPWEVYERYGDERLLRDSYATMQRYLDEWIPLWTNGHIVTAGLGDHLSPATDGGVSIPVVSTLNSPSSLAQLVSTAYYAEFARRMALLAQMLGKPADAARYAALHEDIKAAFNTAYLNPASGTYRENTEEGFRQTANILPLAFNLVPAAQRTQVIEAVAADVAANGGNLMTGVVGTRYILQQLTQAGLIDVAFGIATQTDNPSWGEWVGLGYTALSESWGSSIRSLDHHMFGSVTQWFVEDLAGIEPLAPGYAEIEFRPERPSAGLESAESYYDSVRGMIRSRWRQTATGFELDIIVPPNSRGIVHMPADTTAEVAETGVVGIRPAERAQGVELLRHENGRAVYRVGSGHYQFHSNSTLPEAPEPPTTPPRRRGGGGGAASVLLWLLMAVLVVRRLVPARYSIPSILALATLMASSTAAAERLCTEELVETSDGIRLHVWVSRLAPDGARPVLLEVDSYANPDHNNDCPSFLPTDYYPNVIAPELLERFTLVHVSYRGTGSSEGLFDMAGPNTQRDVREMIAWSRTQDWSNGEVVLTGQSGSGFATHYGLSEPGVLAALIFTSCADLYRCVHRGGIQNALTEVYIEGTLEGHLKSAQDSLRLGTGLAPPIPLQAAAIGQAIVDARLHPLLDDWWQDRSALAQLPRASVPVLYTSEPYDIVLPFDAFLRTPSARLMLGFGHTSEEVIAASGERYFELVRRTADRFLAHYGLHENNGAERDAKVLSLINAGGGVRAYRQGRAYVREETGWPLPDTRWTRLYLDQGPSGSATSLYDGTLSSTLPAAGNDLVLTLGAPDPKSDLRSTSYLTGAIVAEMRTEELRALTYTTPKFAQPVEINGPILLRMFASAAVNDFDWSVRLTDVSPDGSSQFITDGYLRASLRRVDQAQSLRNAAGEIIRPWHTFNVSEPLPRNQPVEYLIEVIPTANWFAPGHRLRLDLIPIASSNTDLGSIGTIGVLTVHRGGDLPSQLLLPLIPARCQNARPLVAGLPALENCAASWDNAMVQAPGTADPPDDDDGGGGVPDWILLALLVVVGLRPALRRRR